MKQLYNFKYVDNTFLALIFLLSSFGLVMMSSASIDYAAHNNGNALFYMSRQIVFLSIAVIAGVIAFYIPTKQWERYSSLGLLAGFILLILVLIPHIGREVNGSMRWIPLGPINLQSSEVAKLFFLLYLASYLVRRQDEVRSGWWGFMKPITVLMLMIGLLLLEPDFGSAVVMIVGCLGMIFLGGVGINQFSAFSGGALIVVYVMAKSSPYRLERLNCFVNPWEHPYDCGYQLTQSLIAFGRGEWFGLGLGNSIQKLFYLPEAHTDFVFAIIAEELGFMGGLFTILLFAGLIGKIFFLAKKAAQEDKLFCAYLAYGIALVISAQVFINIGVNAGLLPTKGLTLPFLSYGGSSLIVTFVMMGILARIDYEMQCKHAIPYKRNEAGARA